MTGNRLDKETSPYLLQHKDNPVHWWAWGPEALAEAKRTGKPILLSVGYAACHWCHVMAHESFEDAATAQVMNDLYVNIKVDREERPDIDAIYMGALQRLGEQGGWPLTMFLDSEARPFWGGTYFPKEARYGRPAFVTVLLRIAEAYQNQPENVRSNAEKILAALKREGAENSDFAMTDQIAADLVGKIVNAVDMEHGGLRGAPKFPQWSIFWLLWRGAMRFDDTRARKAVLVTLTQLVQGGVYDHLGGGFARYSTDEIWLVPHFEKMLYDNALILDLMTEAYRETGEHLFKARIAETVAWLEREMVTDGGGFSASLDADSEGEEGKFYVWRAEEVREVLGDDDYVFFAQVYGVTDDGNFEGQTILNRLGQPGWLGAEDEARLSDLRAKLLARRERRLRPGLDDKVLADWNGLMIAALTRAAQVLGEDAWLAMAQRAFAFIASQMDAGEGRLWHSWRAGLTRAPGSAADYANMSWAALRLYQATGEAFYLEAAQRWTAVLDRHHWDGVGGGYFTAADDTADVIVRLKSAQDDAVPNANAIQLSNLIALAAVTGDSQYDERAQALLKAFGGMMGAAPLGHCALIAAQFDLDGLIQVKLPPTEANAPFKDTLYTLSLPGGLEFFAKSNGVQLSQTFDVALPDGALICVGPTCGQPVFEPQDFRLRLTKARRSISISS